MPVAPSTSPRLDWGGWRARVQRSDDGSPVRGALVVLDWANVAGAAFRARGLSDERGEALVPVAGLPVSRPGVAPGDGPPVIDETPVTLSVFARADQPWPVDPDQLEASPALSEIAVEPETALQLRAGRLLTVVLRLTL